MWWEQERQPQHTSFAESYTRGLIDKISVFKTTDLTKLHVSERFIFLQRNRGTPVASNLSRSPHPLSPLSHH